MTEGNEDAPKPPSPGDASFRYAVVRTAILVSLAFGLGAIWNQDIVVPRLLYPVAFLNIIVLPAAVACFFDLLYRVLAPVGRGIESAIDGCVENGCLALVVTIAVVLTLLFGLVRFVKWAWVG